MLFNELENAFNELIEISHVEKTIKIGTTTIKIKTLTAQDEVEIQKTVNDIRERDGLSPLEFLDAFRKETLSRAIIGVNDIDLSGVDRIETGEVLENGVKVFKTKQDALLEMLPKFNRSIISIIFSELVSLSEQLEKKLESIITPTNNNVEKEILESRVNEIKKDTNAQEIENQTKEQLKSLEKLKTQPFSSTLKEIDSLE
jgi:hypothetical protein